MKKLFQFTVLIIMLMSFTACGEKNDAVIDEPPTEGYTEIQPNSVLEGSEADLAVRSCVGEFLNTFISCDFDAIKAMIHPDDLCYFNFESEDQLAFYSAVFPQIKYDFKYVSEYDGVYGVMTEMTSPDMAEVYGSIIKDYIDSTTGASDVPVSEVMSGSTAEMLKKIKSPELKRRVGELYIYVEYIDGEYIPRCDAYFVNELTGGAPEASEEISSTLYEAVGALSE